MTEKSINRPKRTKAMKVRYITFLTFISVAVLFFILGLGYNEKTKNMLAVDSDSASRIKHQQEIQKEPEIQEALQENEEIQENEELGDKKQGGTEQETNVIIDQGEVTERVTEADEKAPEADEIVSETEQIDSGQPENPGELATIETPETPAEQQEIIKKVAYLTFDDGPTHVTGKLLDVLAQYNIKATFFMLEPNMRKYPEVLTRMVEEGHAIGLHGVSHRKNKFYQSKDTVVGEMSTAQVTLKELTGVESHLIRVPYGSYPHMKKSYIEAVQQAGFFLWDWNVDSKDWFYNDAEMIDNTIRQLVALEKRNEEPVILMHDRAQTIPYVAKVLEYLIKNNYDIRIIDTEITPVTFSRSK